MSYGYAQLHWLLDEAWHGDDLSDTFRHAVMAATGFVDMPLFALQEYCYGGQGPAPTGWAADRALAQHPDFAAGRRPAAVHRRDVLPLDVPGDRLAQALRRGRRPARRGRRLARRSTTRSAWPPTRSRSAPAVYFDDMYVDADLSLQTARAVGNTRVWVTNEFEHDGIAADGAKVLDRLMGMATGRY